MPSSCCLRPRLLDENFGHLQQLWCDVGSICRTESQFADKAMELARKLDENEWFHRPNNYSTEAVVFVCLCFATVANLAFAYAKHRLPEAKRLAWVISSLNALFATIVSFMYVIWRTVGGGWGENLIYGEDNVSVTISLFFVVNTVLDLVWGVVYYPKYLHPLSAWFHHSVYLFLLYKAITKDFSQVKWSRGCRVNMETE